MSVSKISVKIPRCARDKHVRVSPILIKKGLRLSPKQVRKTSSIKVKKSTIPKKSTLSKRSTLSKKKIPPQLEAWLKKVRAYKKSHPKMTHKEVLLALKR